MPDSAPTQIGKYQITDLLGKGAMGVVYRALDPVLNRYVAIKVMSQGIATDQQLRDRFLREARAAGSLQHPNIITIYDFGEAEDHLYIAMEYVEGSDLSEIIERRDPLPLPAKLDVMIDVLHALDYAHNRHVVHRDVKPANIRVQMDGHARVMDFGIARLESSELTKSGMLIGTPHYMAPEQVSEGKVSAATDIFAVGVVLYELLGYRKAFEGDTLHAVLYKVMSEQPPPLREVVPDIPEALQSVLDKALAKDPEARYKGAGGMAQALSQIRAALSGGTPFSILDRKTPLMTLATGVRPQKRSAALWAGVAGGTLAVAALAWAITASLGGAPAAESATAAASVPPAPAQAAQASPAGPAPKAAPGATAPARVAEPAPRGPAPGERGAAAQPAQQAQRGETTAAPPTPTPTQGTPQAATPAQPPPTQPQVPAPAQPTPPVAQPGPQPAAAAATEPPADPRPDIEQLIAAYARAIESKSVPEIRRVYPGMTSGQQQGWEQFFQSVRGIRARLGIGRLDVTGTTAELSVSGSYEYDAGGGRTERQPVSFRATAALDGGAWRLRAIR